MKQLIKLKVNGEAYEVAVEPRRTLLEVLREETWTSLGLSKVVMRGIVVPALSL